MQKNIWIAAKYLRLSIEDGDKAESESIVNQSILIDNYMKSTSDITIVETFKDDGFSGIDFKRPGFQAMLKAIENKEINCIIVKDLSRFGREHIDVDRYIQKVFPQLGVRFIAINDNYDSETANITDTHLVLPVKSFVNDTYCRQNSQKVRSHLSAKRNIGEYVGNYVSYGYKKCDADKSQIEIDPVAAKHVRDVVEIFEKLAAGQSYLKISREFNTMLLASPRVYARTGKLFLDRIDETDMHWQSSVIKQIAENRHYLGNTYSHKTRTSLLTKEKNVMLDKEEWIEHVNTHKAIVSAELFEKVQNVIKLKQEKALPKKDLSNMQTHGKQDNKYVGLIYCGDCGANMVRRYYYSEKNGVLYYNYYFICGNYAKISKEKYNCNRWKEEVIDELVYRALIMQLKTVCELKTQLKRFNGEYFETFQKYLNREQSKIVQLNKRNEARRFELYEQYVSGEIDTDAYNRMTERITVVEKDLVTRQKEIEKSRKITEKLCKKNFSWLAEFSKGKNLEFLTKDVVRSYIKKISLYEDKRIEIEFKFQDEIQALSEILEEGVIRCQMVNA